MQAELRLRRQGGEVGLVVHPHRQGDAGRQQVRGRHPPPAEVGRHEQLPAGDVDQARQPQRHRDRGQALGAEGGQRGPHQPGERVGRVLGRPGAVVALDHPLVADAADQVDRADGEVVDVDLQAQRDDAVALQRDGHRRAADRAGPLRLGLAQQAPVEQLPDQARHGGLVEPGGGGDRRPRPRAVLGDVAQHQAQVVAADRPLVDRPAVAVHPLAPSSSSTTSWSRRSLR